MKLIKKTFLPLLIAASYSSLSFAVSTATFSSYAEAIRFCQTYNCIAIIATSDSKQGNHNVLYDGLKPDGGISDGAPGKDELYP